jgi:hypothetical protein
LAHSAARFGSGLMPEAFAEIKAASELDPTFPYVMLRRMEIARELGDRDDYEQVNARYQRIMAVAQEAAPLMPLAK